MLTTSIYIVTHEEKKKTATIVIVLLACCQLVIIRCLSLSAGHYLFISYQLKSVQNGPALLAGYLPVKTSPPRLC